MKRLPLLAVSAALFLLPGCHKAPPAGSPANKLRIGVIPKGTTDTYWKGAQAGALRAGAELGVDIEWQGPLDDSRIADQIGIFDNLAAGGVAGIVLAPSDEKALAPHVRTAAKRGTPVVIFDSPLEAKAGTDFLAYVATNNEAAGATAAETLTRLAGPAPVFGGNTVVIRFREGSASARLRETGFFNKLKDGKLKVVAEQHTDGSLAGAQRVAEVLFNSYVKGNQLEVAGIFASNAATSEGAYNALKSLRDKGVQIKAKFVGFDDSALLRQGLGNDLISALMVQDPEKMGYVGVKTIVASLNHQPFETDVDTGVTVKTKADVK